MITLLLMAVILLAMLAVEMPLWIAAAILIVWVLVIPASGRKKR